MNEKTTRTQVTPGWTVQNVPSARKAALAEWITLRAAENQRAMLSAGRFDAEAYAKEQELSTRAPMADRASLTMPISGVHVLPVFGRGEHVAPYLGDSQSASEYATPEEADAWLYVAAHAMGDGFTARVIHVMTSEAIEHGRPVDHAKRDDVASQARTLFVEMVTDLLTREDVTRVYGAPAGRIDTGSDDMITGNIAEFLAPRAARCGGCEACVRSERVSQWIVGRCAAPVMKIDAITPSRLLTRAVWRAANDPTLATSAVYATRAPYLRKLASEVEQSERLNIQGDHDVLRNVPQGAADLIRLITAALAITGESVATTHGLSASARTVLNLVMGNADTKMGTELALGKARALWTRDDATDATPTRAPAIPRQRSHALQRQADNIARMRSVWAQTATLMRASHAPVVPAVRAVVTSDVDASPTRLARRADVTHARQVMALIHLRTQLDARA